MGLESIIAGGGKHAAMKRVIKAMRENITAYRKGNSLESQFPAMMDVYTFCLLQMLTDGVDE